ncbi:MAG: hypothetical protein JWM28_38 [Chitinophagaceae bacterium]|nr:hypothetical protein [Chitinophagaceae bacterium]
MIFFSACRTPRYVYAPSPPNNPYFKKQGDSKISAYYAVGGNEGSNSGEQNRGLDVQAAYAVMDHWALSFDHFSRKERDIYNYYQNGIFDSSIVTYHRTITSFGGGYFCGLDKRRKITFNIYGGIGFGKFNINDKGIDDSAAPYTRFHRTNVTKWYLQPGFNFMPGRYFWCSFTTRFVFADYSAITTSYSPDEQVSLDLSNLGNRALFFFEPSFNMQFGLPKCPWLKINSGFAISANMTRVRNADYLQYHSRTLTGYVGITLDPLKFRDK